MPLCSETDDRVAIWYPLKRNNQGTEIPLNRMMVAIMYPTKKKSGASLKNR